MRQTRIPGAAERLWRELGSGGLLAPARLSPTFKAEALVVAGGPLRRLTGGAAEHVEGADVHMIHSAGERPKRIRALGMYVCGEAIFADARVRQLGAASVRTTILCERGDEAIEAALRVYLPDVEIQVVEKG
jgi:hypothetical protein